VEPLEGAKKKNIPTKSLQPIQVALLCKDEIQQYQMATRPIVGDD